MAEYIERERIEKFFDGIYDCADLVFEPNDHCCAADDCGHCKWYEAKNAIAKRILSIPAADVVERKTGKWIYDSEPYPLGNPYGHYSCDQCGESVPARTNFCPNCGAKMMEGESYV